MNWPIRQAEQRDRNYILSTWMKFMRSQYPFSKMSPSAVAKYSARVHALVGVCPTHVCCDIEDSTLIYGFITFDPAIRCIHMVNVRSSFRRNNIGSELVMSAFGAFGNLRHSVYTKYICNARLDQKWGLAEYDPYLMEGEL